ncbi:MAG: DUF433 domain-containing protein [Thermomicrobiales bacterium]
MNRHETSERIVSNPAVMLGKPVIRGTRMPVYLIVDFIKAGHSPEEIVSNYPELTIENVKAAIDYSVEESQRIEV